MYDIFLSHNSYQKPWVRKLYQFLTSKGLNVFFDEESIPPGANVVRSIEDAVRDSRYVVLVISPTSIKSHWVAMETQYTAYEDPDAGSGKLVPIIIEKVDLSKTRLAVKTVNCIDLTSKDNFERRLRHFLRHIGISNIDSLSKDELDKLSIPSKGFASENANVADINDVLEWGWDGVKLLDEFIRLDYETLDDLIPSHEGHSKQWAPIFMNHPETWRMLINEPKSIVGYWHFAPLFPDVYKIAMEGGLMDSEITADRVQFFEFSGWYNVYFVQICMLPQYRSSKNVRLLFQSIFSVLELLARESIFIKYICANAYTDIGRALCKSFNMEYVKEHCEHGSIYSAKVEDILNLRIASSFSELRNRYNDAISGLLRNSSQRV